MTVVSKRTGFALVALLGLGTQVAFGSDELELRYKVKYDLEINVGPESRSFGSRTYVLAGRAIPVAIDDYLAEITISETEPGYYETEIVVKNVAGDNQSAEHVARMIFSGKDGEFVSFTWQTESMMRIRFEIVASGDRR